MKNKKGFTLTELLAVIVVLAIIAGICVMSFTGIRKNILDKDYQNTVSVIKTAALKYAEENNIEAITINVDTLITTGYLEPDDEKEKIYDPRDSNKTLNCDELKIKLENDKYQITYQVDETNKKECNTLNYSTKIQCNGENCKTIWYKGAVELSLADFSDVTSVEWSNNTGTTSGDNTVKISSEKSGYYTYSARVTYNSGAIETYTQDIKIDNEQPIVNSIKYSGNGKFIIDAKDLLSGVNENGYCVTKVEDTECSCSATFGSTGYKTITEMTLINPGGTYKACVKDMVGNLNNANNNTVTVLSAPIVKSLDNPERYNSIDYHNADFQLEFSSNDDGITHYMYRIGSSDVKTRVDGEKPKIIVSKSKGNIKYYVQACKNDVCSDSETSYQVNFWTKATASVQISESNLQRNDKTFYANIPIIKYTASVNNGSILSQNLSGSTISFTVSNGSLTQISKQESYSHDAEKVNMEYEENCDYYCDEGDLSGSYCYFDTEYVDGWKSWDCINGYSTNFNSSNRGCPRGYTLSGFDCGNVTCGSKDSYGNETSCTNYCDRSSERAEERCDNYSYCPRGYEEYRGYCYRCNDGGTLNRTTCNTTRTVYYDVYNYTINITYYY